MLASHVEAGGAIKSGSNTWAMALLWAWHWPPGFCIAAVTLLLDLLLLLLLLVVMNMTIDVVDVVHVGVDAIHATATTWRAGASAHVAHDTHPPAGHRGPAPAASARGC